MREIYYTAMVIRCLTAVGVAAITSTKEGAEGAACGCGSDGASRVHIAEFGAAAE